MIQAETSLLTLVAILSGLTVVSVGGIVLLDIGLSSADQATDERALALAYSDRIVTETGPVATDDNILPATTVESLTAKQLTATDRSHAIGVRLDERTVLRVGDPAGGTTVRRLVLIEHTEPVKTTGGTVTVPAGVDHVMITAPTATIIRANDRVIHQSAGGIDQQNVALGGWQPTQLTADTGELTVRYNQPTQDPGVLTVTVDRTPDTGGDA